MLILTENAIDVIEALTGGDAGLRLFGDESHGAPLRVAVTREPRPGDDVVDARGVRIYVDAVAVSLTVACNALGASRPPRRR